MLLHLAFQVHLHPHKINHSLLLMYKECLATSTDNDAAYNSVYKLKPTGKPMLLLQAHHQLTVVPLGGSTLAPSLFHFSNHFKVEYMGL